MAYTVKTGKATVGGLVEQAYSDFQSLRDEMSEWRDNMEEKLSHTSKYETVSETAETLDGFCDSDPDVPASIADEEIEYNYRHTSQKSGPSRSVRCGNACSMLEAAIEFIEEKIDGMPDDDERAELEILRDDLSSALDEATSCEFPGMYG